MLTRTLLKLLLACALLACTSIAAARTVLIDVRTPEEYAAGHLEGALNIAHAEIGQRIAASGVSKLDQLIVYCQSGRRSHVAGQTLTRMGYRHVLDYGAMERARQRLVTRSGN